MSHTRIIPCPSCGGCGEYEDYYGKPARCIVCNGTGDEEIEVKEIAMEDLEEAHG